MKVRDIPSRLKDIINDLDIDSEKMIGYQIIPCLEAKDKVIFRVIFKDRGPRVYKIEAEDAFAFNLTQMSLRDKDVLKKFLNVYFPRYLRNLEELEELWRDYLYYKSLDSEE